MKTQINSRSQLFCLVLLWVLGVSAHAETQPGAIPFSDIGAKATVDYQGEALSVASTADGARLRCGFQKLEGHATTEGLWLESTEPGSTGRLRLAASALSRGDHSGINFQPSTTLPTTGTVTVEDKLVRFTRPGVTEEYSVSADGVRQDFVITERPVGTGDLRLELTLSGARAETVAGGVRLKLEGSGRELLYNRLRAQDATGRELTARFEVLSGDRLAVSVDDASATYPVRIDPTFSDADWVSLNPDAGPNGGIKAIAVDDCGNLYVGGTFTQIGGVSANGIAKWDGKAWSALGSGMSSWVLTLAVSGSNVYAGGYFTNAGGVAAHRIARWNGSSWSALGSGIDGPVYSLLVSGTDLYAGGNFSLAGGMSANGIAKWDGNDWSALGSGVDGPFQSPAPTVYALAFSGTNLYAGGNFFKAGEVVANGVARWDGNVWCALGSGVSGYSNGIASVNALAVSGTNLYAGGHFTYVGGVPVSNFAKWDGSGWSALGSEPIEYIGWLAASGTNLYAAGAFPNVRAGSVVARWDGSGWSDLGLGFDEAIDVLALSGTDLYVGGILSIAGGRIANNIAKWDGNTWSAFFGPYMDAPALVLAVSGDNLYVGGWFSAVSGAQANYVAEWNGNAWSALGQGLPLNYHVSQILALAANEHSLYAGGVGDNGSYIAKWDGTAWSVPSPRFNSSIHALAVEGTNLYAGGNFTTVGGAQAKYITRWDGFTWSALGSGINGPVFALAVSGTNLYAGGDFGIAKWDGKVWSALMGSVQGTVYAMTVRGTDLYVAGTFTRYAAEGVMATNVAKWDGSAWSALGLGLNGPVRALAVSGSNLYAGGDFNSAGGATAKYIAKWNGSTWSPLGSGTDGSITALAADEGGHLFVGGYFALAGTNVSPFIAQANLGSAPSILSPPQSQTAEVGATVNFTPDAVGYPALTFMLSFNGTNLFSCGTNDWLELSNVGFSQAGTYTVVVTNVWGALTSAPVMLNVIPYVDRRIVPAVSLNGQAGDFMGLDCRDSLSPETDWETMVTLTLSAASQFCFDISQPLPPQRFYRAWQTTTPGAEPWLDLHLVPAITLSGNVGDTLRLDYINAVGPTDAWVTLDTVTLTNTSQLYFDTSSIGQPPRLWRIVPVP